MTVILPDLFGERDGGDIEWGNTFLHNILHNILPLRLLAFRQTVVRPPSGVHLRQPGSHPRQTGGARGFQKQTVQPNSYARRRVVSLTAFVLKKDGSCTQLFGYQNSLFSWPEGNKGGIHHQMKQSPN